MRRLNILVGAAIGLSFLSIVGMIVVDLHLMFIPEVASYSLNAAVVPRRPEQEWINSSKVKMDELILKKKDWILWERGQRKNGNENNRKTGTNDI